MPARIALTGVSVVAVLATSLGQAPLASATPAAATAAATAAPATVAPAAPLGCRPPSSPLPPTWPLRPVTPGTSRAPSRWASCSRRRTPARRTGSRAACGSDALPTSEHYDGRAVDWMNKVRTASAGPGQRAGKFLISRTTGTSRRSRAGSGSCTSSGTTDLGAYNPAAGWEAYDGCTKRPPSPPAWTPPATATTSTSRCPGTARSASPRSGAARLVTTPDYGPCRPRDLNWAPAYTRGQPRPVPVLPEGQPGEPAPPR